MVIMSGKSKVIPVAIFALFLIQIFSPAVVFPADELPEITTKKSPSVGFSTGSGHDLAGDTITVDGKNWTVRGDSILDFWESFHVNHSTTGMIDVVVADSGILYACTTNSTEINFHTLHLNGTFETLMVEDLGNQLVNDCSIGLSEENRIQIAYDVSNPQDESSGADIRLARLAEINAVYLERTWHIRTIAENIYSQAMTLRFDSDSKTHIFFKDSLSDSLRHLSFNKAYWNQTVLDAGPIGSEIEVEIDADDVVHIVYTKLPDSNATTSDIELSLLRFSSDMEMRQTLARGPTISQTIGMDLDSNNIEQIAYYRMDGQSNKISLLRSLAGKDVGRIDPTPKYIIDYDEDSQEGDVLSADINGDSIDDLIYTDPEGNGTISIHYGTSSGPPILADRMLVGTSSESNLGASIALGDFNCDGFDDLASSEPGKGHNESGYISVRLGSSSGINDAAWWEMTGQANDSLGWSLTSMGDVESDGCDDLAVAADKLVEDNITASLVKNGLVAVFKGNSTEMVHHTNITQSEWGTMFGRQIIGGGDINGDGFLDLVISNTGDVTSPTGYSSVEFFLGNESGIISTPVKTHVVSQQGKLYGYEMAFVGDVHGDGFDDILITELYASTPQLNMGKVHMWAGSATGPINNWTVTGSSANDLLGYTISPAGDINEDGFDDFLMMNPSASKSGTITLYLGAQNGPRMDTQILAQGAIGENVGLNILSGMDIDGDGMGEILYSSRDLTQGDDFAPVLTMLTERDWEFIDFDFSNQITDIDLKTPLRGSPSLMVLSSSDSNENQLHMLENTQDGTSAAGRWDNRLISHNIQRAELGLSNSGKPTILAIEGSSNDSIICLTVDGNTGLDLVLDSGTGLGKQMGSMVDSEGNHRIGHSSPSYSTIFYTEEGEYGYSTSLVRSSIDLAYSIDVHVDSNQNTRMVYVDDDDYMVRLATLNGSWNETSILNTTIGNDFDSLWTTDDRLIFAQIAISNNSTYLQVNEYHNSSVTVNDVVLANHTSLIEIEQHGNSLLLSLLDGEYLRIFERNLSADNWTKTHERWMYTNSFNQNSNLIMKQNKLIFDSNNSDQGIILQDSQGQWVAHQLDIPDSNSPIDMVVAGDRWHISSSSGDVSNNHLVWTTGSFTQANSAISTSMPAIETNEMVALDSKGDSLLMTYSLSSNNNFHTMRLVSDIDRDLIPDTHDDLPLIGNQWEDQDSDGFGDNQEGPMPDICPTEFGGSLFDVTGCADYDGDGWSDSGDDCVNDDGTSWWGEQGCDDYDQDGWTDDGILGDRYPTNWKQALDTDRDSYGDNHGPDCCNVTVLGVTEVSVPDLFPYNRMQWEDNDNDGYGDNESDTESGDKCWWIQGFSWRDRLGCVDSDGDGASDPSDFGTFREWNVEDGADKWPDDGTQWADSDGDGYGDNSSDLATLPDKFPSNPSAANDTDGDGYPNNWTSLDNETNRGGLVLDNCPNVAGNSTSSMNLNGSIVPYYGCIDTDGDGREDTADAFPDDSSQTADSDGDGWGDNQNGQNPDACPYDFGVINGTKPDGTIGVGCPIESDILDSDNDGIADDVDTCPFTQQGQEVDSNGCSEYQKDDDQDGVSNAEDLCAATPYQETVDANGCSDSQKETDTDGDGLRDPYDLCPGSDSEQPVDENGCNLSQKDTDGDGVNDLVDECPDTGPSIPVLADGCVDESALDEDIDGDGYKGLYSYDSETETHTGDAFPTDSTQWHDLDGDGYGDNPDGTQPDSCPTEFGNSTEKSRYGCLDTDGDGYHDGLGDDKFPTDPTQWEDRDLDTWGDNPEGSNPDECPDTDTSPRYIEEARLSNGCADYQKDDDEDGKNNEIDFCPNTPPNTNVDDNGCEFVTQVITDASDEDIFGMDPLIFVAIAGGGGLVFVLLIVFIIVRIRNRDDFDFDDDDDYFDDEDDEDDFMSKILGNKPSATRGPRQTGPVSSQPARSTSPSPSSGRPTRGPQSGPQRGPPSSQTGPTRPPVDRFKGPDSRGPPRGQPRGQSQGRTVAKKRIVSKSTPVIDPDLFTKEELDDRRAAVDWTKGALTEGESERTILMQLQTTGWSAPQSRAIIDLSKN